MRKLSIIISALLTVISIAGAYSIFPMTVRATSINIGDYVQLGKYYEEPILWRCVDIDENGPLMLADRILCLKPFDAKGTHKYLDGTTQNDATGEQIRTNLGSNLWQTSNLRAWLNSTATAGNVAWVDGTVPNDANVDYGKNNYENEKGFLANGNFTLAERNAIKLVTHKATLGSFDSDKLKTGGTEELKASDNITAVLQNYENSFYHNLTDSIFLLDVKKGIRVMQNSSILGNYIIAKPTAKAVANSEQIVNDQFGVNNSWWYWTSSQNYYNFPYSVMAINNDGLATAGNASNFAFGVRPAFYLNLSNVGLEAGTGIESNPYLLSLPVVPPISAGLVTENTQGYIGDTVQLPITIMQASDLGSYDFTMDYDATRLEYISYIGNTNFTSSINSNTVGQLKVSAFHHNGAISGDIQIGTVVFKIKQGASGKSEVTYQKASYGNYYNFSTTSLVASNATVSIITVLPKTGEISVTKPTFANYLGEEANSLDRGLLLEDIVIAKATATNTYSTEKQAMFIIALYKDNKLLQIKYKATIIPANSSKAIGVYYILPQSTAGCTLKAFVVDSLTNMAPLGELSILN